MRICRCLLVPIFIGSALLSFASEPHNYGFLLFNTNNTFFSSAALTYDYEPSYNNGSLVSYGPNGPYLLTNGFQTASYDQYLNATVSFPMKSYSLQINGNYGESGALKGNTYNEQSQGLSTTTGIGIQRNLPNFQEGLNINYLNNSSGANARFTPGGTVGVDIAPSFQYETGAFAYAVVGDMQQTYSRGGLPGLALQLEPQMTWMLNDNLTYASLFEWRIVNNNYINNGIVSTSGNLVMGDTLEYQPLVLMYRVPQIQNLMLTFEVKLDWYNFRACQTFYGINYNSWVTFEPDIQYYWPIAPNTAINFDVKDEISQLLQASNYGRSPNQQNFVIGMTLSTYFFGG